MNPEYVKRIKAKVRKDLRSTRPIMLEVGLCYRYKAYALIGELIPRMEFMNGISPEGTLCDTRMNLLCLIDTLSVKELIEICNSPEPNK